MPHQSAIEWIDANADLLKTASQNLWEHPEPSLAEFHAAALLSDILEAHGFDVQRGVAGLPTAFVAEFSRGLGPTVAFLGEYDALPELAQAAVSVRKPLDGDGYGHGCGHNLLGVGALGAALAAKAALVAGKAEGTVRFYGCPAEELLVGKVYMVRAGLFSDCDLAVTWHPGGVTAISAGRNLAMNSARFSFHGVSAHAAVSPHAGRSALDAVELMNVGTNFLREHVIPEARIHYVITHGGIQPNVVPSYAQVWYYVRAPRRSEVEEIYQRVLEIAQGAALMAGVTHEVSFVAGCYDTLRLESLLRVTQSSLERVGAPIFSPEEKEFAREIAQSFAPGQHESAVRGIGLTLAQGEYLSEQVLPDSGRRPIAAGSTDVGDVSWNVPTAELRTACWPVGNSGHSWQNTACAGSGIGAKGMLVAAKAMALTALECMTDADVLRAAKEEFDAKVAHDPYVCPIPPDVHPELP